MASGNPDDPQEILKKIERESAQDKKRKTMDILKGENKGDNKAVSATAHFLNESKIKFASYSEMLFRKLQRPETQKTIMVTAFFMAATYISWKVESKYDRMRKRASRTKTFKEEMVEKQNEQITRYLSRNQFESVPIKEEYEPRNPYKFEEEDEVLSTKQYLLEQIAREYRDGIPIDPKEEKELRDRGLI